MIIIMLLATIIWVILCGSIFLMGCFILGHTIFNLVHSTLCIGEVCNIEISGGTKASAVKFQLIAKHKGKMIKVEPLTTLTILPFWENAQLKRFQKKISGETDESIYQCKWFFLFETIFTSSFFNGDILYRIKCICFYNSLHIKQLVL